MTCENCTNEECKCFNLENPEQNQELTADVEEKLFFEAFNSFLGDWKRTLKTEILIAELPELVNLGLNAPRNETVLTNINWLKILKIV